MVALPNSTWITALLIFFAVALGTVAHAGIGLLLAGVLRAEAMLAVANVAFMRTTRSGVSRQTPL